MLSEINPVARAKEKSQLAHALAYGGAIAVIALGKTRYPRQYAPSPNGIFQFIKPNREGLHPFTIRISDNSLHSRYSAHKHRPFQNHRRTIIRIR